MTTLTLILWKYENFIFNIHESVQFSHSVRSDSLQPHGLQHTRPPRPSPTPGVDPSSCPLSRWCHPTISSSVVPLLLLPSIASVQRTHKSLLQHHSSKASVLQCSAFFTAYFIESTGVNSHIHAWLLEKPLALTIQTFVGKGVSLLFNMLPRLVISFPDGIYRISPHVNAYEIENFLHVTNGNLNTDFYIHVIWNFLYVIYVTNIIWVTDHHIIMYGFFYMTFMTTLV